MSVRNLLTFLVLYGLFSNATGEGTQARSSKKGVVIPSWPKHHCYDFTGFTTIRSILRLTWYRLGKTPV